MTGQPETERIPVLVDTDVGTNIDDALALWYLLCHARCELVGVTTVTGQASTRAQLVGAIAAAGGRQDLAIHPGAERALAGDLMQPDVLQAPVLMRHSHRATVAKNAAPAFLARIIRSRPHEITVLAIGPLTNIAMAFAADPELPHLVRRLVMMGGVYSPHSTVGPVETNARLDPLAAARVFESVLNDHVCIGLDVTHRCRLSRESFVKQFGRLMPAVVLDMAEIWFHQRTDVVFHDPLAAACIFEPSLCILQRGRASIETGPTGQAGLVQFDSGSPGPHGAARTVDVERFFEHYRAVISN